MAAAKWAAKFRDAETRPVFIKMIVMNDYNGSHRMFALDDEGQVWRMTLRRARREDDSGYRGDLGMIWELLPQQFKVPAAEVSE